VPERTPSRESTASERAPTGGNTIPRRPTSRHRRRDPPRRAPGPQQTTRSPRDTRQRPCQGCTSTRHQRSQLCRHRRSKRTEHGNGTIRLMSPAATSGPCRHRRCVHATRRCLPCQETLSPPPPLPPSPLCVCVCVCVCVCSIAHAYAHVKTQVGTRTSPEFGDNSAGGETGGASSCAAGGRGEGPEIGSCGGCCSGRARGRLYRGHSSCEISHGGGGGVRGGRSAQHWQRSWTGASRGQSWDGGVAGAAPCRVGGSAFCRGWH